jgi:hypothetical protein
VSVIRSLALIVLALGVTACNSESKPAQEAGTPTATASDCTPPAGMATSPRSSAEEARDQETMYLSGVTAQPGDCGDQVVFEFKTGSKVGPGFRVSYEPAKTAKIEDGSGRRLRIAGSAFLVVRLSPAMTAEIVGEDVKPTYTGPRVIKPEATRFVHEVVKSGDFEALVTWVIGLNEKRPFKTTVSSSQLVVEIG